MQTFAHFLPMEYPNSLEFREYCCLAMNLCQHVPEALDQTIQILVQEFDARCRLDYLMAHAESEVASSWQVDNISDGSSECKTAMVSTRARVLCTLLNEA